MKHLHRAVLGFGLAVGLAAAASAQPPNVAAGMNAGGPPRGATPGNDPVAKGISMDLALEASKAAEAACKGWHIGIAILDQVGTPKLYYIPDGTAGWHAYTSFRKANTALLIKAPSEGVRDAVAADPAIAAKYNATPTGFMTNPGGLPIVVNGETIGAIGVSGGDPGGKDKGCATAGLAAIQSRLK